MFYIPTQTTELRHHGILGMKWGVRRTQAQLGNRTSGKTDNDSNAKKSTKKESPPPRKSVKDMSDEELKREISRLELEKRYDTLNPESVSLGKKIIDSVVVKTLAPAAMEAGKQLAKDYMIKNGKKALGLNDENAPKSLQDTVNALKSLQDTVNALNLKKQYRELTDGVNEMQRELRQKQLTKQLDALKKEEADLRAAEKAVDDVIEKQKDAKTSGQTLFYLPAPK